MTTDILACPEAADAAIAAPAWKNLLFMRDGRTELGHHTFPTEGTARKAAEAGVVEIARLLTIHPDFRVVDSKTGEHCYYCREFSHSIPLPWRAD